VIPDIAKKLSRWVRVGELHLAHAEEKLNIAARRQEVGYVHILMDYLGIYLPAWLKKHPESAVEIPEFIENFYRSIFWRRTKNRTTFTHPLEKQRRNSLSPCFNFTISKGRRKPEQPSSTWYLDFSKSRSLMRLR